MRRRHASFLAFASLLVVVVLVTGSAATSGAAAAQGSPAGATPTPVGDACTFPLSTTDATGTTVTLEADPGRFVALHPSAAQTMWEIGAREEVVGMPVNQYTSYLEGHERPANVVAADGFTVNVEAVVNLTPDLVLAPNVTPVDTVAQLRRAGLTVYHFREAASVEDVYAKTLLTGRLTGNCGGAAERTARMRSRIDRVREAVRDEPRPSVIYPLGGGVVAGSGTFLHEVVATAGGSNLAAEAGISGYKPISAERIIADDPQWLILNEGLPLSAIQMDAYNETTAVREGQVVRINPNYANQPAPRVALVVERIARALHPEAMAAANGTAMPRNGGGATATTIPAPATETAAPGQPGFGFAAGLVAIAVALLVVGRAR